MLSAASMRNLATMYVSEHNLQDIGLVMGIGHACESLPEGSIEVEIYSSIVERTKGILFYARKCAEGAYELYNDNQKTAPALWRK